MSAFSRFVEAVSSPIVGLAKGGAAIILTTAAGLSAVAGDDDATDELLDAAKDCGKEFVNKAPLASSAFGLASGGAAAVLTVSAGVAALAGDDDATDELLDAAKTCGKEFVERAPVISDAKMIVDAVEEKDPTKFVMGVAFTAMSTLDVCDISTNICKQGFKKTGTDLIKTEATSYVKQSKKACERCMSETVRENIEESFKNMVFCSFAKIMQSSQNKNKLKQQIESIIRKSGYKVLECEINPESNNIRIRIDEKWTSRYDAVEKYRNIFDLQHGRDYGWTSILFGAMSLPVSLCDVFKGSNGAEFRSLTLEELWTRTSNMKLITDNAEKIPKKLMSRFRGSGSRRRSKEEAIKLMRTEVPAIFQTSEENMWAFINGKEISHIVSSKNKGTNLSGNVFWEDRAANRFRSSKNTKTHEIARQKMRDLGRYNSSKGNIEKFKSTQAKGQKHLDHHLKTMRKIKRKT